MPTYSISSLSIDDIGRAVFVACDMDHDAVSYREIVSAIRPILERSCKWWQFTYKTEEQEHAIRIKAWGPKSLVRPYKERLEALKRIKIEVTRCNPYDVDADVDIEVHDLYAKAIAEKRMEDDSGWYLGTKQSRDIDGKKALGILTNTTWTGGDLSVWVDDTCYNLECRYDFVEYKRINPDYYEDNHPPHRMYSAVVIASKDHMYDQRTLQPPTLTEGEAVAIKFAFECWPSKYGFREYVDLG